MSNPFARRPASLVLVALLRACIALCLLTPTRVCRADDYEGAKAFFEEGVRLFLAEDYGAALTAFEHSYEAKPKASVLFNIAMCYKALGEYERSTEVFAQYLQEEQNLKPSTRAKVEAAMTEMAASLEAEKRQETSATPEAPDVRAPPIPPSEAPGPDAKAEEPEPLFADAAQPRDEERSPLLAATGWTCLALGIGSGIAGIYFTAMGISHQSEGEDLRGQMMEARDLEQLDEFDDLRREYEEIRNTDLPRDRAGAIVGYTLAGAFLTTGIVLLLVDKAQRDKSADKAAITSTLGGLNVRF